MWYNAGKEVPLMIVGEAELRALIAALEARIVVLEAAVEDFETRIAALEGA